MPEEVDRYPNDPLDGPAQFKDMLKGLERRIGGLEGAVTAGGVPVGVMFATRNPVLDDGYLWCDGGLIPAEYTALIAICGPNTPDLQDRTFVGLSTMGGSGLGDLGGSADMMAHTHPWDDSGFGIGVIDENNPGGAQGHYVRGGSNTIGTAGTGADNYPPFGRVNVIIKY